MVEIAGKKETDILVIGGGIAGIRAAVAASEELEDNGSVLLVTKGRLGVHGSSFYPLTPGWGFQAARVGDNDDIEAHYEEIMEAAQGMANPRLAKILVEKAPFLVDEMKQIGLKMGERDIVGDFSEKSRAIGVLDRENIKQVFTNLVKKSNIQVLEKYSVVEIIKDKSDDHCCGALFINQDGKIIKVLSKAVIMATGGYTNIYKYNLNSPGMNGDGYALALNAGATLTNLEFMQFMFGIIKPRCLLFPEKLFSLYPPIYNKSKEEFLEKYIPEGLTLEKVMEERAQHGPFSTNYPSKYFDIACYQEMGENQGVYVDLKSVEDKLYQDVFTSWLNNEGIKLANTFEIAPCASVANGGVVVDENCESNIPGLFAVGEIMAGPHGADRLGGNMMSSVLVFGKRVGHIAAQKAKKEYNSIAFKDLKDSGSEIKDLIRRWSEKSGNYSLQEIQTNLKEIMWNNVAICRNEEGLKNARGKLHELKDLIKQIYIPEKESIQQAYSIFQSIEAGLCIIISALQRKESRGPHYRQDYPEKNEKFGKPIMVSKKDGKIVTKMSSSY